MHLLCDKTKFTQKGPSTPAIKHQSTCSLKATQRGPSQKVVSYAFYIGPRYRPDYFTVRIFQILKSDYNTYLKKGIFANIRQVSQFYLGWVIRIYHNIINIINTTMLENLTAIERESGLALDLCFMGDLPGFGDMLGNNSQYNKNVSTEK
jgi:hypothetical protein